MRVIASFLFVASITLLMCTHHALAQLETEECDPPHSWQAQQRERYVPPAFRQSGNSRQQHIIISRNSPGPAPRPSMPSSKTIRFKVSGKPQTDEKKAYQDALREARDELVAQLRELKPDLRWEGPRFSQVDRLVASKKTDNEYFKELDTTMYTTHLEIELEPRDQASLLRHVRLEEAGARQLFLLKPLLAVLAVLLTIAGYYRLEDMTKGYYTLLLRLCAALLLGVLGVGIFLWI